jgi:hypothetical protein
MGFVFCDLDNGVRHHMLAEVDSDIATGTLGKSKRFSPGGADAYPALLREAVMSGDERSLTDALSTGAHFVSREWVNRGRGFWKNVPSDCAQTFAEGEFNRFYIRGLCIHAMDRNCPSMEVYRAKLVREPRPESDAFIGTHVEAAGLLADLRSSQGGETFLGLAKPNSGLSARISGLATPCDPTDVSQGQRPGCSLCPTYLTAGTKP